MPIKPAQTENAHVGHFLLSQTGFISSLAFSMHNLQKTLIFKPTLI